MTDVQETAAVEAPAVDLDAAELYFNRELSTAQFNERVLELAEDDDVPLLERVKFCAIFSSNTDEFFMVRVAGLHDRIDAGIEKPLLDGRTPTETLQEIRRLHRTFIARQSCCLEQDIRPKLAELDLQAVFVHGRLD